MPAIELPQGRYLSCAFTVAPHAGGQTRALLMRNRLLARAGPRPEILILGAAPDLAEREAVLRERGLLTDGITTLSIYEHYREHGWGGTSAPGEELPDLGAHRIDEQARADGTPWRVKYRVPGTRRALYDYLHADGSPYLRIPAYGLGRGSSGHGEILQIGEDGTVVGRFEAIRQWFRRWIRELAAAQERTFVFIDSRFVVPHVVPLGGPRLYVVYVMHNLHVQRPYRWDSPTTTAYKRVLERIGRMDAMVTLTDRQREDIAQRRGRTSNMFVVPNPVDLPDPPPELPPRDPRRVAVVARLEPQKRLTDAIAAFEQVVEAVPEARLDIFGDGSRREELEAAIDRRGLAANVTLRGFDPHAREALWTASAFLMTSSFEGYPLSTLESMSRGCPVVSYDIKYGPREQITDGVDGFLLPRGDVDGVARRVIELLRSPELVAQMSAAARARVAGYGPDEFVARWADVLRSAGAQRRLRTRLERVDLRVDRLRVRRGRLQFAAELTVDGRSRQATLDSAEVTLAAIDDRTGEVTPLGLKTQLVKGEPRLRVRTPPVPIGGPQAPAGARLRLRLTWRNSAWETELPGGDRGQAAGEPPARPYAAA